MGFGGSLQGDFKLWIDKDILEGSYSALHCPTFGSEPLVVQEDPRLQIMRIEVWGCGEDSDLEAQQIHREREHQNIVKNRKVDKMRLIQSDFDKEYFFGGLFKDREYHADHDE